MKRRPSHIPKVLTPVAEKARAEKIWALREAHKSYREIAAELGCSYSVISEVLAGDPARLDALQAAAREERAKLWQRHEHSSLQQSLRFQQAIYERYFNKDGTIRKKMSGKLATEAARWAAICRQSASDAAAKLQSLGQQPLGAPAVVPVPGEPGAGGAGDASEADRATIDTESLVDRAIRIGRIDILPPVLAARAQEKMKR